MMQMQTLQRRSLVVATFLVVLAIALNALLLGNLLVEGPFEWHFTQPSTPWGAIECAVLFLVLIAALRLGGRLAPAIIVLVLFAYLRRHNVDLPVLVAWLYVEAICGMGLLTSRWLSGNAARGDAVASLSQRITAGIPVAVLGLLALSLTGLGTARDLAIALLIVAPLVLIAVRKDLSVGILWRDLRAARGVSLVVRCLFIVWIAVLAAKTNFELGYDTYWYGLRGEYVLAPFASLFDRTGLVSPVYYFPKLYELLLLPLNAVPDYSFSACLAVGMYVLACHVTYEIAERWSGSRSAAALATLAAATLPAFTSLAVTSKPDMLAWLFLLLSVRWAMSAFAVAGVVEVSAVVYALMCAGLAAMTKLPSGAFAVAIMAVVLVQLLIAWRRQATFSFRGMRLAIAVLAVSLAVTGVLLARTFYLAGVPTIGPDVLIRLWAQAGWELRTPVGTLDWVRPQDWTDVPTLIYDMLVRPSRLLHLIVTWPGSIWLWGLLAWLGVRWAGFRSRAGGVWKSMVIVIACCGVYLALAQRYAERGGDGNYFVFACVIGTVALLASLLPRVRNTPLSPVIMSCIGLFIGMQLAYAFVSMNWATPGTRALDWNFRQNVLDSQANSDWHFDLVGVTEINEKLRQSARPMHVVGYGLAEYGYRLAAIYEPVETFHYLRPEYFETAASFAGFVDIANVDALLVPTDRAPASAVEHVVSELATAWRVAGSPTFEAGNFALIQRPAQTVVTAVADTPE